MKSINGANEVESLKGKYGSEVIKRWSEIESLKFPLKIEKLARMEMSADGCCFGMSMDFISRYLHEIKVGKTPLEAVKTIAPIYADGSPVEGELAQIFFDALDTSIAIKDYKAKWLPELENILKKDQDKALEEAASRLELDNVMKVKASEVDRLNPLDSHKIPLVQKLNEIRSKFYFDRALKKAEIAYGRFNIIAEKMGLSSRLIDFFHIEDAAEEAMDPRFPEFIDKLPLGAYQIGLLPQEGDGHSIAFIKTGEGCFLFEPSLATLTLTQAEAAKGLWHVGKELYLKKGACSMSLSLIEPA